MWRCFVMILWSDIYKAREMYRRKRLEELSEKLGKESKEKAKDLEIKHKQIIKQHIQARQKD